MFYQLYMPNCLFLQVLKADVSNLFKEKMA